jgi:hypothetical protein
MSIRGRRERPTMGLPGPQPEPLHREAVPNRYLRGRRRGQGGASAHDDPLRAAVNGNSWQEAGYTEVYYLFTSPQPTERVPHLARRPAETSGAFVFPNLPISRAYGSSFKLCFLWVHIARSASSLRWVVPHNPIRSDASHSII